MENIVIKTSANADNNIGALKVCFLSNKTKNNRMVAIDAKDIEFGVNLIIADHGKKNNNNGKMFSSFENINKNKYNPIDNTTKNITEIICPITSKHIHPNAIIKE